MEKEDKKIIQNPLKIKLKSLNACNNFLNHAGYELNHIAHMIFSFGADQLTNVKAINKIKI